MKKLETVNATNGIEAAATAVNSTEMSPSPSTAQTEAKLQEKAKVDPEGLSPEELRMLKTIRARQMLRTEDSMNLNNFGTDAIDGWAPLISRGTLSLVKVAASSAPKPLPVNLGVFQGANMGDVRMQEQQAAIAAH